jgi:hypothetical protein
MAYTPAFTLPFTREEDDIAGWFVTFPPRFPSLTLVLGILLFKTPTHASPSSLLSGQLPSLVKTRSMPFFMSLVSAPLLSITCTNFIRLHTLTA